MLFPKDSEPPVGVDQSTADSPLICQPERLIRGPPSLTRLQLAFHGTSSSPIALDSLNQAAFPAIDSPLGTGRSLLSDSFHTTNSTAGSVCDDTRADELRRLEQDLHLMRVAGSVEWRDLSGAIAREHWKRDNEVNACEHVSCKTRFGPALGPVSLPRLGWSSSSGSARRASIDIARPSLSNLTRRMRTTSSSSSRSSLLSVLGSWGTEASIAPPSSPETTQFDIDDQVASPTTSSSSWLPFEAKRRHHCRRCGAVVCADHSRAVVTLILEDTVPAPPSNAHSLHSNTPSSEHVPTPYEQCRSPMSPQAQEFFASHRYSIDELMPSALPTVVETPSSKTAKQPKSMQEQQRLPPLPPRKGDETTSEVVLVSSPESSSNETWTTDEEASESAAASTTGPRAQLDVIQEEGKTASSSEANTTAPASPTRAFSPRSPQTAKPIRSADGVPPSWLSRAISFVSLTPSGDRSTTTTTAAAATAVAPSSSNGSLTDSLEPPSVARAPRTLSELGAIAMREESDGQIGIRARVCPMCARAVERARERALSSLRRCDSAPLGYGSTSASTSISAPGSVGIDELGMQFSTLLYAQPTTSHDEEEEQDEAQRLESAREYALSQARVEAERKREQQRELELQLQAERERRLVSTLSTRFRTASTSTSGLGVMASRRSHSLDGRDDSDEEEPALRSPDEMGLYSLAGSIEHAHAQGQAMTGSISPLPCRRRPPLRHTHTAPASRTGSPEAQPKGARLASMFAARTASSSRSRSARSGRR